MLAGMWGARLSGRNIGDYLDNAQLRWGIKSFISSKLYFNHLGGGRGGGATHFNNN